MDSVSRSTHSSNVNRDLIVSILAEKRIPPPSAKEIAERIGVTEPTVRYHLNNMAADGIVIWTPGRHRSLRLVENKKHFTERQERKDKQDPKGYWPPSARSDDEKAAEADKYDKAYQELSVVYGGK